MERDKNILFQEAPERLSNIVKGIVLIIVSLPISLFTLLLIGMSGFRGDFQGPDRGWLAASVAGVIFLVFLIFAIRIMIRSTKKV